MSNFAIVPRERVYGARASVRYPWADNHFLPFPGLSVRYLGEPRTAKQIIADTAERHGIEAAVLKGRSRSSAIVIARREAASRLYEAGWSVTEIGRLLDRDHSTISVLIGLIKKRNGDYYRRYREQRMAKEGRGE